MLSFYYNLEKCCASCLVVSSQPRNAPQIPSFTCVIVADDPECDRKKKACCDVLINTYLKSHYTCRCTSDASLM